STCAYFRPTLCSPSLFSSFMPRPPPRSTLFPYTTLFRSNLRRSDIIVPVSLYAKTARKGERGRTAWRSRLRWRKTACKSWKALRSEEHTSELQSRFDLVCRLLLEKKKKHELETPTQGRPM